MKATKMCASIVVSHIDPARIFRIVPARPGPDFPHCSGFAGTRRQLALRCRREPGPVVGTGLGGAWLGVVGAGPVGIQNGGQGSPNRCGWRSWQAPGCGSGVRRWRRTRSRHRAWNPSAMSRRHSARTARVSSPDPAHRAFQPDRRTAKRRGSSAVSCAHRCCGGPANSRRADGWDTPAELPLPGLGR